MMIYKIKINKLLKLTLTSLLLLIGNNATLNAQLLSKNSTISILTYGPLEETYLLFGHNSIRVQDADKRMDILFNYGMFDFAQPNFIGNFLQGKLLYSLGVQQFQPILSYNKSRDRHFTEQVLNLTLAEKNELYNLLKENYRPENRDYYYDFYFDNCATRLRDILKKVLKDKLVYATAETVNQHKTFRQLLDEKIEHETWTDFGIDLILGTANDVESDFEGQMFLPSYVEESLAGAKIKTDSSTIDLVLKTNILYNSTRTKETNFWTSPLFLLGLLSVLMIGFTFFRIDNIGIRVLDGLFFAILVIVGLIITFMWFGTTHETTKYNWNLLWTIPTQFILAIAIFRNKIGDYTKWYFLLTALIAAIIILTFPVFPQQLHVAFIPILLIVVVRSLWYSNYLPFLKRV